MQLEDVQLSIRPRTILECLDVTFLFCGRHALELCLTAAVGIVPIASFNWWVMNIQEMDGYFVYLLLSMELPLATMFVTLYLGQATFSRRISVTRLLKDAFRAFPGMLGFQVILRALCLAIMVLVPVVFLGMYYLNEIILLEKPPLQRVWNRRTAMNANIIGRIVSFRMMDAMILYLGTIELANLFRAISSLWEDQFDPWKSLMDSTDPKFFVSLNLDWQEHAAFWVIIVFLTVFRFVSYLDCRIRREGWDVDLKLRNQVALHREREAAA